MSIMIVTKLTSGNRSAQAQRPELRTAATNASTIATTQTTTQELKFRSSPFGKPGT